MARGTKEQKQEADDVDSKFPYRGLLTHPAWSAIDRALGELEANHDVRIQTARRYLVGYLLQHLLGEGLISPLEVEIPETKSSRKKLHAVR
ncbi:MAG TPA: hypothetical protein VL992_20950 [Tepidisphaeraceae bacterium]|nr:hypothetical protein [Tepidisphaeraceae bacterium]